MCLKLLRSIKSFDRIQIRQGNRAATVRKFKGETMSKASKAGFSGVKVHKLKGRTKATPEEREKAQKQRKLVERARGNKSER